MQLIRKTTEDKILSGRLNHHWRNHPAQTSSLNGTREDSFALNGVKIETIQHILARHVIGGRTTWEFFVRAVKPALIGHTILCTMPTGELVRFGIDDIDMVSENGNGDGMK